jgi:hypothetical protein
MSKFPQAQNPLLLRYHRLMDAFAKSDDERDFYLDKVEGFIIYVDLDKGEKELSDLDKEIHVHGQRYALLPKMTFYETKKFMEGFINEKVYDIDTKEKLLDIIQSREARDNFLEFIYDHHTELEKWQQYYVERSRIRIIEWLRLQEILFVFEEDLDLNKNMMEKLKRYLFDVKVSKDVATVREALYTKAKTYYSNEALNPRPKRGRPPKQVAKVEIEPQVTVDMYTMVPSACRTFLYLPDITNAASITFSAKFDTEAQLLASLRGSSRIKVDTKLQALSERLESLRHLSTRLHIGTDNSSLAIQGIKQLKQPEENVSIIQQEETKKSSISEVVKDFLPSKKKLVEPLKKKSGIKTVTQIRKQHKKR